MESKFGVNKLSNILQELLDKKILIHGDSKSIPLPDESVDCIIFSPSYWMTRIYGAWKNVVWWDEDIFCPHFQKSKKHPERHHILIKWRAGLKGGIDCRRCGSWYGQLGMEPDYDDYINHLMQIMDECKRILKKTGVLWCNISDTYFGSQKGSGGKHHFGKVGNKLLKTQHFTPLKPVKKLKPGCQVGIPERYSLAMIDHGWIKLGTVIWVKQILFPDNSSQGSALPFSGKNRLNNTHEYLYYFAKNKGNYFNLDAIRSPIKQSTIERCGRNFGYDNKSCFSFYAGLTNKRQRNKAKKLLDNSTNPCGKNPGNSWLVQTEFKSDTHFATFGSKLIERPILCSCPEGGVVFDPFLGSGTTVVTALRLGRKGIGCDINEDYLEISSKNIMKILEKQKQTTLW